MHRFSWRLALALVMVTGCTKMCSSGRSNMSPEQVVEGYLDKALNMKEISERDQLADYTTGNLKAAIESASPETIKSAYIDRTYKLKNYSVIERRDRTPRETEITFRLTYQDLVPATKAETEAPEVTTENTVVLIKESGAWLIRDVVGNKTSIDFPVSEESKITAKAGQVGQLNDDVETEIETEFGTPPSTENSSQPTPSAP